MINASVNAAELNKLNQILDGNAKKFRQQLYIATNKAAAKTKARIAKEIAKDLAVPQKLIKKTIILRKAKPGSRRKAVVTQKNFKGMPIGFFKGKQNKEGITFRAGKSTGAIQIPGAFMGPKPGVVSTKWRGDAYKRKGSTRQPIEMQRGPSAWSVFVRLGVQDIAVKFAREQLTKEITERARFLGLKKSGAI